MQFNIPRENVLVYWQQSHRIFAIPPRELYCPVTISGLSQSIINRRQSKHVHNLYLISITARQFQTYTLYIIYYTNIPCDCDQYTRIFSRGTLNCMDVLYSPTQTAEGNIALFHFIYTFFRFYSWGQIKNSQSKQFQNPIGKS
jgi:hypothetical protein